MRVLAFASGKGGVGKTTVSLNVSISLARDFKRKILLLDANLDAPHLTMLLGPKFKRNISHYRIGFLKKVVTRHKYGFYFLPASYKESQYEKIGDILLEARKSFDFVILDTPPGFTDEVRAILSFSDEIIPIITLDPLSLVDGARIVRMAERLGKLVPGVIINRVERKPYEVSKAKVYKTIRRRILGEIPEDPTVKEALAKGKPALYYNPRSPASRELRRIAGKLLGFEWNPPGESFIERMLKIFKR